MTKNTHTKMGEQKNDNRDIDNRICNVRDFMDVGRMGWPVRRIRNVVTSYTNKRGEKMNTVKNAIARMYIATRNALNDESGQSMIETALVVILMAVVVVIVATAVMGMCDNSDAAGNLLGGALGID